MRWIAALAVALLLAGHARAQQRNAHWPIPPGSWLHFDADGNHVDPWVISSIYNYRSASISSPTGELQLYNDAYGIYNANGDTLIAEDPDSYAIGFGQGWLYCTWPGDNDRIAGSGILVGALTGVGYELKSYSFRRDLSTDLWQLEAGSGQVLIDSTAFVLTAVAHGNGADYWILTHLHSSDTFASFRLSAIAVDPVPVISHIGTTMPIEASGVGLSGPLVASSDGTQLALSISRAGNPYAYDLFSELYHFATSTGVGTKYATLPALLCTRHRDGVLHGWHQTVPIARNLRWIPLGQQHLTAVRMKQPRLGADR